MNKAWWGLGLASLAWVVFTSALDVWLLQRIPHLPAIPALQTAVALLCLIPFTLSAWAVPLAVSYRLRYDRRIPAGLPSWRQGHRVFLVAHFRSAFWRGYAALFAWSLLLIPMHLIVFSWWMVALHISLLAALGIRAGLRQWRNNRNDQTVIDAQRQTLTIPALGEIAWKELRVGLEEQLVVTPRRDTTLFWVTLQGQRWKQFPLPEQAQELASWLTRHTTTSGED